MAEWKGFCKGAYTLVDRGLEFQRCVNLYYEKHQGQDTLRPTGGYKTLIDFGDRTGSIRAMYRTSRAIGTGETDESGSIIIISGPRVLHFYPSDNTFDVLGTISNQLSTVDIVDDGVGMVIADGTLLYRLDMDTLDFTTVDLSEINILYPERLAVIDFRTVMVGKDANGYMSRFYYSDIADNNSWGGLSFDEFGGRRDSIVNVSEVGGLMYLWGRNTTQVWTSDPDSIKNPLVKQQIGTDDIGLYANGSLIDTMGVSYFVGNVAQGDPMIYAYAGNTGTPISTPAIEEAISATDVSNTTSYTINERGHTFVVFNFDDIDKTFVYDVKLKEWHERSYRDSSGIEHRWQPQYSIAYNGVILMGSHDSTILYEYGNHIYDQSDSGPILRTRSTANLKNESKRFITHFVNIRTMVGTGIEGSFDAVTMMMRYAYDGGYSGWSSRIDHDLGVKGDYMREVQFRRLGLGRALVVEVSISDKCGCGLNGASLESTIAAR